MADDNCKAVPTGWRFYAADASILGKCSVMLTRDKAETERWHSLPEAERDAIALFVSGVGANLDAAMSDAISHVRGVDAASGVASTSPASDQTRNGDTK